jgi:hypothetical protein
MRRLHDLRHWSGKAGSPWGRLALVSLTAISAVGCGVVRPLDPTPLPGWFTPVSELFVDESALPVGWQVGFPEDTMDPAANHVWREWWGPPDESGFVFQSIWRAYTVAAAEERYDELRVSQFEPSRPSPYDTFVPFEPPDEIGVRSQVADEFYVACGWWGRAYCEVVARYRNYVVELHLDREAECEGRVSEGLTYPEIETIVTAMDARFAEAMEEFYPTPR